MADLTEKQLEVVLAFHGSLMGRLANRREAVWRGSVGDSGWMSCLHAGLLASEGRDG